MVVVQEKGEIFFFYRPKVDKEEAHGPDDVQRLYIVLRPESSERCVEVKQDPHSGKEGSIHTDATSSSSSSTSGNNKGTSKSEGGRGIQEVNIEKEPLLRLIVMGKKSLPDLTKKGLPYWGFVEMVTTNIEVVKTALKGDEYDTPTKGHRWNAGARALGEGIYRIIKHQDNEKWGSKKAHTHLIYKLKFPREGKGEENIKNEPQECLNIEREGSFLIQIKNPDQQQGQGQGQGRFRGLASRRKAVFPAHLQGQFGKLRYSPADPPDFLNYEGCELLLISASDDIEEELGLELETEEGDNDGCSDLVKTFGETASTTPLFKGTWA
ncbi:hypothetical protein LguiA_036471 [Lonicera macranthoides]